MQSAGDRCRTVQTRWVSRWLLPVVMASLCVMVFGQGAEAQQAKSDTAQLNARIQSLEEQLVDMQVVVGTLESLAKSGAGAGAGGYRGGAVGSAADAGRIDSLENQIRALAAELQQLNAQVRAMQAGGRQGALAPSAQPSFPVSERVAPSQTADMGFGSTTVTPGNDAIGGLITQAGTPSETYAGAPPSVATAALAPVGAGPGEGGNPKQLYETAYGHLLQRDYGAAEAAFTSFLQRFPNDSLSGNAQYWLGETYFVRGQYKAAASAFLKGYQTYAQGSKAPDSLLKLAMSLDRLGQKDAACSSYNELTTRFPNAPQSVRSRAKTERQRVGCT